MAAAYRLGKLRQSLSLLSREQTKLCRPFFHLFRISNAFNPKSLSTAGFTFEEMLFMEKALQSFLPKA